MSNKIRYQPIASSQEIQDYFNPNLWHEIKDYLFYFVKIFVSVGIMFIFLRSSVVDRVGIKGVSMYPNYNPGGEKEQDEIFIDKITPKFSNYKRGQVIVLIPPHKCAHGGEETLYIKRVIGLPGEQVRFKDGKVFIINDQYPYPGIQLDESDYLYDDVQTWRATTSPDQKEETLEKIPQNSYFFMGDNRTGSQDSRICGTIEKSQILGQELYRLTPVEYKDFFRLPVYNIGREI
jgi:signal peptidase I